MTKRKKTQNHHIRSVFAAICGALGLLLIIASFFAVWLNRTLTDTETYVGTVAPLVHQSAIQDYIAVKTSDSITGGIAKKSKAGTVTKQFPAIALAPLLLAPKDMQGKTPAEINTLATSALRNSVHKLVASPDFAKLWADTNRSAHSDFVAQINSGATQIELDLRPAVAGLQTQLSATKLAPLGAAFTPKGNAGILPIKGRAFDQTQKFYKLVQGSAPALVVLTLAFFALAIMLSVHHKHTVYRVVLGTGIVAAINAVVLWSTSFWKIGGTTAVDQQAAVAVVRVLFRNLQLASLGIAVVCLGSTIGFRLYKKHLAKTN